MSGADVVRLRGQLLQLTERLIREHRGSLSAGVVIRTVAGARDDLRAAGAQDDLLPAVEELARKRLSGLSVP